MRPKNIARGGVFYIGEKKEIAPAYTVKKYLKIPRDVIYLSELDEKRISCFLYFLKHITFNGTVSYSCDHLVKWCGYKPSIKKYKNTNLSTNDKFANIIEWLYRNYYISDFNYKEFCGNYLRYCSVNDVMFLNPARFGVIYDFEFQKVENIKSWDLLLLVLSYLRLNTWNNKTGEHLRPEIVHRQYSKVSEDTGVSVYRIKKSIQTLCDIGILKTATVPRFRDQSGAWHTEDMIIANKYKYHWDNITNTYLLDQNYDCDKELEFGVQYLQQRKRTKGQTIE